MTHDKFVTLCTAYDMTLSRVGHDSFICGTWHICMWDMTHACHVRYSVYYIWHDSVTWGAWLIHMSDMTHVYVWHNSRVCAIRMTWLMCMCDMTYVYVWHDSCVCATWLMCMCDMTQCTCDMTAAYEPFCFCLPPCLLRCVVPVTWLIYICGAWLIHTCKTTHLYVGHDVFTWTCLIHMWFVTPGSWLLNMWNMTPS